MALAIILFLFSDVVPEPGLFDALRDKPVSERIMAARDIYKANLRKVDSAYAFKALDGLRELAVELDDRELESSVYDLQADYFSVNRGFNDLSLKYYHQAIREAKRFNLPVRVAVQTYKLGTFYNTFGKYAQANRYFVEALDQFREIGFGNIPRIAFYLLDLSNFYYKVGDLETSRNLAREALTRNDPKEDHELNITNTIALVSQGMGDEEEALNYFFKALRAAEQKRDSIWIGIISSNIGGIYYHRADYRQAETFLKTGYREALKFGDIGIALGSAILLASNYMAEGEMRAAEENLLIADGLVRQVDRLNRWVDYYKAWSRWHELNHEPGKALAMRIQYEAARDSLQKVSNVAEVERVKWRWEIDKHQAEMAEVQAKARTEMLTRNFIIAVLFLLMVISILIYNRRLVAKKNAYDLLMKEEELLKSQKERAEEELKYAAQSLNFFTESLKDKNRIIEEFKSEIERLHKQVGYPSDEDRLRQLDRLIQSHLMTDEAWREFQSHFERVHYGFIARLRSKFEVITETDIRLLALIKLGLNNREMSNVLGVTTEAIKKSRQRLKKKIDLPEEESLEKVVSMI